MLLSTQQYCRKRKRCIKWCGFLISLFISFNVTALAYYDIILLHLWFSQLICCIWYNHSFNTIKSMDTTEALNPFMIQGSSQKEFGGCRLSCLCAEVYIDSVTNSWDDISRTLFANSPVNYIQIYKVSKESFGSAEKQSLKYIILRRFLTTVMDGNHLFTQIQSAFCFVKGRSQKMTTWMRVSSSCRMIDRESKNFDKTTNNFGRLVCLPFTIRNVFFNNFLYTLL